MLPRMDPTEAPHAPGSARAVEPIPYALPAQVAPIPRHRPVINGILAALWFLASIGTFLPILGSWSLTAEVLFTLERLHWADLEDVILLGLFGSGCLCYPVF